MLRNGYRGHQRFRLRQLLKATKPIFEGQNAAAYSARAASEIRVPELIYYAASVFWRAAVHSWEIVKTRWTSERDTNLSSKLSLGAIRIPA